ncbi:MAG: diacylglycerol/lipid kinase family protein [SAR324 cluster bacterium]
MKVNQSWTVIYNPASGGYRPGTLERILRTLQEGGIRSVVLATEYPGHAVDLCRALPDADGVACYSGDGTLNEVATGLIGRNVPIAFLPGGTANVMAHELGLPCDPVQAARLLMKGRPRPVRPGTVGPGIFLLMAGIGFDAMAVSLVGPRLKALAGRGAYVWAGIRALFAESADLRVSGAGEPAFTARWLVAARAGRYGGAFVIHPAAGLEAPALGVAAVGAGSVVPFLVANLACGRSTSRAGRRLLQTTRLLVEAAQPVPLQVDGDSWGRASRFEIGISTETVPLFFPER